VLPAGFVKIRHFGFLANPCRKAGLMLARKLVGPPVRLPPWLTQTVKTLLTDRGKLLDRQDDCTAYSEAVGEAEAGHAGEQTAKK
jgi:hypothetical protein